MLEIEQKFADADFAAIEKRLDEWQARHGDEQTETDHYFNAPDRDFARTDEAFRLRRVGSANFLTYKGPKHPGAVKVRTELEIALRDGDQAAEEMVKLLAHLGYRAVAIVRKRRRTYRLLRSGFALVVCLDEVEQLGRFAEVEIVAAEEEADSARSVLADAAAALGLTNVERRSYLNLVLQKTDRTEPAA